ncbi:MAG: hypothetical protein PHG85_07455 [Candidatus Altiarchaeota archaeon]|nr:hypothetical protein [Candidatus Altiarchaeota archaeon]
MCKPASFIVLKDRVVWSKRTDSHEDIIAEFGLHEGAARVNFVRVEISPAGGDLASDPASWVYRTDQDSVPKWYDPAAAEAEVRAELAAWVEAKVIASGRRDISDGQIYAYGSATVKAYGSATVRAYGSATVRASDSATVKASGSATVEASGSATVEAYGSATVRAYGSALIRDYRTNPPTIRFRAGAYKVEEI